jgi:hypothetical protein
MCETCVKIRQFPLTSNTSRTLTGKYCWSFDDVSYKYFNVKDKGVNINCKEVCKFSDFLVTWNIELSIQNTLSPFSSAYVEQG